RLPGPGALPALRALLNDGHAAVRREAVFALAVRGELRPAREWLASNAYDTDSRVDLASRVAAEGDLAQALDFLLLGSPVDGETSGLAGAWALELGLFDAARGFLTRGLATRPLDADLTWARFARALQAARDGKPEAAAWIRNCVDSAKERVDALNAAAYLLAENGLLLPMALEFASEAAAAAAGDPHVLDTLGWTQLAAGRTAEAARTFRSFESRDGTILYHKAIALALAGEPDGAAGSLSSALVARPGLAARARRHPALTPLFLHTELLPWR
ncbi:MAG: hypothetical protein HUU15_15695, partial [Candidatus Brocadiae bacterium]|nr:hypothetical protein [Candidatus Brocadiia bacterium]